MLNCVESQNNNAVFWLGHSVWELLIKKQVSVHTFNCPEVKKTRV